MMIADEDGICIDIEELERELAVEADRLNKDDDE